MRYVMPDQDYLLYSFRRCPYAIRARTALAIIAMPYRLIEVDLRNKPSDFLAWSPKGTVPVLVINQTQVIDESIDIVDWCMKKKPDQFAPDHSSDEEILASLSKTFIPAINHIKYPDRYTDTDIDRDIKTILGFLGSFELQLTDVSFTKLSRCQLLVLPLVRQFYRIETSLFEYSFPYLESWLKAWLDNPLFKQVMAK